MRLKIIFMLLFAGLMFGCSADDSASSYFYLKAVKKYQQAKAVEKENPSEAYTAYVESAESLIRIINDYPESVIAKEIESGKTLAGGLNLENIEKKASAIFNEVAFDESPSVYAFNLNKEFSLVDVRSLVPVLVEDLSENNKLAKLDVIISKLSGKEREEFLINVVKEFAAAGMFEETKKYVLMLESPVKRDDIAFRMVKSFIRDAETEKLLSLVEIAGTDSSKRLIASIDKIFNGGKEGFDSAVKELYALSDEVARFYACSRTVPLLLMAGEFEKAEKLAGLSKAGTNRFSSIVQVASTYAVKGNYKRASELVGSMEDGLFRVAGFAILSEKISRINKANSVDAANKVYVSLMKGDYAKERDLVFESNMYVFLTEFFLKTNDERWQNVAAALKNIFNKEQGSKQVIDNYIKGTALLVELGKVDVALDYVAALPASQIKDKMYNQIVNIFLESGNIRTAYDINNLIADTGLRLNNYWQIGQKSACEELDLFNIWADSFGLELAKFVKSGGAPQAAFYADIENLKAAAIVRAAISGCSLVRGLDVMKSVELIENGALKHGLDNEYAAAVFFEIKKGKVEEFVKKTKSTNIKTRSAVLLMASEELYANHRAVYDEVLDGGDGFELDSMSLVYFAAPAVKNADDSAIAKVLGTIKGTGHEKVLVINSIAYSAKDIGYDRVKKIVALLDEKTADNILPNVFKSLIAEGNLETAASLYKDKQKELGAMTGGELAVAYAGGAECREAVNTLGLVNDPMIKLQASFSILTECRDTEDISEKVKNIIIK